MKDIYSSNNISRHPVYDLWRRGLARIRPNEWQVRIQEMKVGGNGVMDQKYGHFSRANGNVTSWGV